jgi:hypothetical protein
VEVGVEDEENGGKDEEDSLREEVVEESVL